MLRAVAAPSCCRPIAFTALSVRPGRESSAARGRTRDVRQYGNGSRENGNASSFISFSASLAGSEDPKRNHV